MDFNGSPSLINSYIRKLLLYSRNWDANKFLKYLLFMHPAQKICLEEESQQIEVILRKKGALQAITTVLHRIIAQKNCDKGSPAKGKNKKEEVLVIVPEVEREKSSLEIVKEGLRILGNAFAIDPEARKEALNSRFLLILHKVLEHPKYSLDVVVQTRVLKCLGNLYTSPLPCKAVGDISWGHQIKKSGIVDSVLDIIKKFKKSTELNKTKTNSPTSKDDTGRRPVSKERAEILRLAVRALRILAADPEAQAHICKSNGIPIVGNILVWWSSEIPNNMVSEILRAVAALSDLLRTARDDVIHELKTTGETFLKEIVAQFRNCNTDLQLMAQLVACLTNFARNKGIFQILRDEGIFSGIFSHIETTSDFSILELLVKLLKELVTKDSIFHSYLLPHSLCVGSTLKILRSPELAEHHCFILNFYENLHGSSIPDLTSLGLTELLHELLRETYKDCTYESVRDLICSVDVEICPAHTGPGLVCPFLPRYRCMSPTYLQVQEEVKEYLAARTDMASDNEPPTSNWKRGDLLNLSDDDMSIAGRSPSTSPRSLSPVSSDVGSDDDEGVGNENTSASNCFVVDFSDGEEVSDEIDSDHLDQSPSFKKRRVDFQPSPTSKSDLEQEGYSGNYSKDKLTKIRKIASVIGILKKLVPAFKPALLNFAPTLLTLLINGKLSCMKYEACRESSAACVETTRLTMSCFYGSDYILRELFAEIGNFHSLLQNGIIPLIHRLILLGKDKEDSNNEVKKCNEVLQRLLSIVAGVEHKHNTSGWRQGYLIQLLISPSNPFLKEQALLAIPLLYPQNGYGYSLQEFEFKGGAWSYLFNTLGRVDEIPSPLFQDSITALAALCETFGLEWTEPQQYSKRKQLISHGLDKDGPDAMDVDDGATVTFELDDGESVSFAKDFITSASPVFEAMFQGSFKEAEEQRVKLPNASKLSLQALVYQIRTIGTPSPTQGQFAPSYDLATVFELLALSNRYLFGDIYERTINSIVSSYICPYSAPTIYEQAIQLSSEEKLQQVKWTGEFDFHKLVLKYLLVGPNIGYGLRCSAFKKIFDSVEPVLVIQDLKFIFEHCAKSRITVGPTPRRNLTRANFMLKS